MEYRIISGSNQLAWLWAQRRAVRKYLIKSQITSTYLCKSEAAAILHHKGIVSCLQRTQLSTVRIREVVDIFDSQRRLKHQTCRQTHVVSAEIYGRLLIRDCRRTGPVDSFRRIRYSHIKRPRIFWYVDGLKSRRHRGVCSHVSVSIPHRSHNRFLPSGEADNRDRSAELFLQRRFCGCICHLNRYIFRRSKWVCVNLRSFQIVWTNQCKSLTQSAESVRPKIYRIQNRNTGNPGVHER